jgi:hypothetical protein
VAALKAEIAQSGVQPVVKPAETVE